MEQIGLFIHYVIAFGVGASSGYIVGKLTANNKRPIAPIIIVGVVCLGWILSLVYSFINPEFKVDIWVHGMMGAIVGYYFKFENLSNIVGGQRGKR